MIFYRGKLSKSKKKLMFDVQFFIFFPQFIKQKFKLYTPVFYAFFITFKYILDASLDSHSSLHFKSVTS